MFSANYCRFSPTHKNAYQFTYIKQTAPDNPDVQRSLQNHGGLGMKLASHHPFGT